jgi:ketosteroid isomerase-like protein
MDDLGEQRIAIARRFNDAFAATPFDELRAALAESESIEQARERLGDNPIAEFITEYLDPHVEIELEFPGAEVLTGRRTGIEGFFQFWREWLEPWEDLRTSASNYAVEGNHVFVDVTVEAEGGQSGAPVTRDLCQVWSFEGDKVVAYSAYPDRAKAMAIKYEGG